MRMRSFVPLGLFLCLIRVGAASAATFTVDTTADDFFGQCMAPGDCSLRSAIIRANQTAGADTIVVPAGVYELAPPFGASESMPAEAAFTGDLDVSDDVTITGAGASSTIVDAGGIDRVFQIVDPAVVSLSDLTVRNGNAAGDRSQFQVFLGGGILNQGTLTVSDCAIVDNLAPAGGGGIANQGTLTVVRSTIRNNVMAGRLPLFLVGGGGIESVGATLTVSDSLIADNRASTVGGGIDALNSIGVSAPVSLTNVTLTGNRAELAGGGVFGNTTTTLTNVTITGNTSEGNVGGVSLNGLGAVTLANSIIAGNNALGAALDCAGIVNSAGYNLIGDTTSCNIGGDLTGNLTSLSPVLSPLQANGGPTSSHAPRPTSPVREAGNPAVPGSGGSACAVADQRGIARPVGAVCDMGAVESNCGDGVQQGFEACEDGNAVDGDGCDSNCTPTACGNGIATGSEQCDEGAGNGGNCCTGACALVDADGDGACDRDDPCTGAAVIAPRLTIMLGGPAPGDEKLAFGGTVTLPLPLDPVFDPRRRGVRFRLEGGNGTILDTFVSGGDRLFRATGWDIAGFQFVPGPPPNFIAHRWIYRDRTKPPVLASGINLVKVRRTPSLSDRFAFAVRGKSGSIAVGAGDLPLKASLVFDVPTAESGQCAEVAFGDCRLSPNGKRVSCK